MALIHGWKKADFRDRSTAHAGDDRVRFGETVKPFSQSVGIRFTHTVKKTR
jgi:hypothetical protein